MKLLSTIILLIPFSLFSQIYFCNDDFCSINRAEYGIYDQKLYKGFLFDEASIILNYDEYIFYKKNSNSNFDVILEVDAKNNTVIKDRRSIFFLKENRIYFSEYDQYKYIYFTSDTIYLVINNQEKILWSTFGNEELTTNDVISILIVSKI